MANIKELLANMIGKINSKLNAPEQAAQPHQQLVTDSNGVTKWEDKTHYSTRDEFVLIDQALNFASQAGIGLYTAMLNDTGIQFERDKTYIVEWDGDVHSVQPIEVSMAGMTMVVLGNAALMNAASGGNFDDTGESFCIGKIPPEMGDVMQFFTSDTSNTHAVKVSAVTETIKTIDPKYLPSVGGGGFMRIDISVNEDESLYYANVSGVAITEALNNGIMPYCVIAGRIATLQYSPALSPVSALSAAPMHEFSGIQIGGTGNSFVIKCEIDMNESEVPCRAYIEQYSIASDVLELVT